MKNCLKFSFCIVLFFLVLSYCSTSSKTATYKDSESDEKIYSKVDKGDYKTEEYSKKSEEDSVKGKLFVEKSLKPADGLPERVAGKSEKVYTPPAESGLKAGYSDDNKQFNYFVNFLEKYKDKVTFFPINIKERIIFKVIDRENKSIPNALITVSNSSNKRLEKGLTLSDGSYLFFPSEYKEDKFKVKIEFNNITKELEFTREGKRVYEIQLLDKRPVFNEIPLDIVFVFDTTGSMGEEIERLKSTIEIIYLNISSFKPKPKVRFGMVLYKDRGDEYVTKVVPLTDNLDDFKKELDQVFASGGGDGPEDLQEALKDTIKYIKWNNNGIRLAFIITDAPPHLDYEDQKYTYVNAVKDAKAMGIKISSVGTGGLPLMGEYVLRQISQYTSGKYIFLTYGERGESEGGSQGAVSHHTGENFTTDKLESIIIGLVKEELSYLVEGKIEIRDEYFKATKKEGIKKEEILKELFDKAITQLVDYSSVKIEAGTPTAIINLTTSENQIKKQAEYFTEQIALSLANNKIFKMVERKDLQSILKELELQSSDLFDEDKSAKLGKFLGAKILITGKVYTKKDNYEIFLKTVRVETAEVLSITKIVIDKGLGL
ncbi:MAG TPA: VWA domain-containing protein [Spirochaetota bacterium]|nr:VWA domain-containing protein [Spirochaetota bacterium]HOM38155.1 VWA domain-containing protein [Spirochaetota bacterium]HPQ48627.1 VWA domain-containing protein [Spirochaetota bacterium]